MGQRDARQLGEAQALSSKTDRTIPELVTNLVPVVKKRLTVALYRSA